MRAVVTAALLAILASVSCLAAPSPAAKPAPIAEQMAADPKLKTKVSLGEKTRPLDAVVAEIAHQTGAKLSTSRVTGDEPVTVLIAERPASEVLALLARHFDYEWRRSGEGYVLDQDLVSQRKEAALRNEELAQKIRAIQDRLRQLAAAAAGTPKADRQARMDTLLSQLNSKEAAPEERARAVDERRLLQDLTRPGADASLRIYASLTPVQLNTLWTSGDLRLSTANGTLPPGLVQVVQQARQDLLSGGIVFTAPGGPDRLPDEGPPTGAEVMISLGSGYGFRATAPGASPPLTLSFTLNSLHEPGQNRDPATGQVIRAQRSIPVMWSPNVPPAAGQDAAADDDPELKKPVSIKLEKPQPEETPSLVPRLLQQQGRIPLGDALDRLQAVSGMDIISDAYIRARVDPSALSGEHTLGEVLRSIDRTAGSAYKRQGNLLLLRSRRWFEDRPQEVPQRIYLTWKSKAVRAGAASLDDFADLANRLSDLQLRGLDQYWGWYFERPTVASLQGVSGLYGVRQHLRFWASLGLAQRQQALAGQELPVRGMSRIQSQAFAAGILTEDPTPFGQPIPAAQTTPASVAEGAFTLRPSVLHQQEYSATDGQGRSMRLMTLRPPGAPDQPPPAFPDGLTMQPAGPPQVLDSYTFTYLVGAGQNRAPAKSANLNVPRRKSAAGAPPG